jgi:hypothetical protein
MKEANTLTASSTRPPFGGDVTHSTLAGERQPFPWPEIERPVVRVR